MKSESFIYIILVSLISFSYAKEEKINGSVHFIRVGAADSMLIESNGHFGLIDSAKAYKYNKNEVKHVDIEESKGEKDQATSSKRHSVQAVLNYLDYLGVEKLDFILATHSHCDHIGGMPAIAYKYVDSSTKYYYREYRETMDDTDNIEEANYKYFKVAVESMIVKGAQMKEITDKTIEFKFGNLKIEFLNNYIHENDIEGEENQNSIATLVTYKNTSIFLASDMLGDDDKKIKDYLGKIDVLKLAHHGYSETSYEFLSTTRPNYIVISNDEIPEYANQVISYAQNMINSKVYFLGNIKDTTESVEESAIKLYLTEGEEREFYFSNTGKEVDIRDANGWSKWGSSSKITYLEDGLLATGWRELELDDNIYKFYFNSEGIMVKEWNELDLKGETHWFYFDKKKGNMLTGWQKLKKDDKSCKFFFQGNGVMVEDTCIEIDNKEYCFDKKGCLDE